MRNAGDRSSGGSSGRRQRGAAQDAPSRTAANGGASLFTPAYRVSHPGTGTRQATAGRADARAAGGQEGYGRDGVDQAPGYGWDGPDHGQSQIGYQQAGYDARQGDPGWPGASADGGYPWAADDDAAAADPWSDGGLSDWTQAPAVSNAVRGFPPAPGEPLPVYPPGPFAAWNRGSGDRARERRRIGEDTGTQLATATITPDEFDTNHSIPAIKDPVSSGPARQVATTRAPAEPVRRQQDEAGRRRPRSQDRSGGRARGRHQPAWLAIGAAVAIIAVGAAVLFFTSSKGTPTAGPKPGSTPTHTQSAPPQPPAGKWEYIGSRKSDAVPLTMHELYPSTFVNGVVTYNKVKAAKTTSCRSALIGSALKAAVRHGHCSQAVRATYVSQTAGVMATIGVFNLDKAATATQAATKAGHFNFVAQLQPKAGPARKIGQGTGIEEALVKGHYLVLVWAEFTDLHAPKAATDRAHLGTFMNTLINKTVNVSLSNRMVDGKPLSPAPA